MKKFISLLIGLCIFSWISAQEESINLSGLWRFQTDPMGFGKTPGSELYTCRLTENIMLPGSMDENGKGIPNNASYIDRLNRKFEYCGQAWYQREIEIPESWKNKEIILFLERCHWETSVYVDGIPAGTDERLSTPNRFVLTRQLTPGIHTLTLCIDNRLKYPMDQWTHGTTEYTQTNWNGVVGRIMLQAKPKHFLEKIKITPNIHQKSVGINCTFHPSEEKGNGKLTFIIKDKKGQEIAQTSTTVSFDKVPQTVEQTLQLGKNIQLWNEFSPTLYTLEVTLNTTSGTDCQETKFGMREVTKGKHHIRLNEKDIHLRGILDCAVFPLTGYPSTCPETWKRIFQTVQDYGFNHIRFHSWCPPEAAFTAADELGLYLQVELPMWIKDAGKYPDRLAFFRKEMIAILDEYGNHPSFLLFCNGNENEGDFTVLENLIKEGQQYDNRHLYSASTARTHVASDQFYTSHVTNKGWITVYEGTPGTEWDRNEASDIDVPVIAHETGQRCMFPNFQEIPKYTGILEARNFKVFQERLTQNGMLHQANEFFQASGAHTVLQYKEVNEALLRTSKSGGFQLLGLADFPGQGSAFVGILDAFWESKGLVSPEKFRESCAPVVLLARFPKRIYSNQETFIPQMEIYQYGEKDIPSGKMKWKLTDESGKIFGQGNLSHNLIRTSRVDSLGKVKIPLAGIHQAGKYTFKAEIAGTIRNEWDIWIYPMTTEEPFQGLQLTNKWSEARELLLQGKSVCFIPDTIIGRKTKFASHFWNPIMFDWAPMIVGTSIHSTHPVFHDFPTSYYADWQWYDILNNAGAIDLTDISALTPIIQSIDTYEVNRKLGIAFEVKVGTGKLFFLNLDVKKQMEERPATRQLLLSLSHYLCSENFQPALSLPMYQLDALFTSNSANKQQTDKNAAVLQLLNTNE